MKRILAVITVIALAFLGGCQSSVDVEKAPVSGKKLLTVDVRQIKAAGGDEKLLTVDFQEGKTLRYKFVSNKDVTIDMESSQAGKGSRNKKPSKYSESVEMVIAYTPLKVDPYGLTTIQAVCESVNAKRSSGRGSRGSKKDAVETLAGKTFTFTVDATGEIEDYSEMKDVIQEAGKKAFRAKSRRGNIKEPDMIGDFIATQWFLWDSISSRENPADGIHLGETWTSKLSVPVPTIIRRARDVVYTIKDIRKTEKGQVAVIQSRYSPSKSVPGSWPAPYPKIRFRMSGTFGFYKNYEMLKLDGSGREFFNIDTGQIERYDQNYEVDFKVSLMIPLGGVNPMINIKQTLTMELL